MKDNSTDDTRGGLLNGDDHYISTWEEKQGQDLLWTAYDLEGRDCAEVREYTMRTKSIIEPVKKNLQGHYLPSVNKKLMSTVGGPFPLGEVIQTSGSLYMLLRLSLGSDC